VGAEVVPERPRLSNHLVPLALVDTDPEGDEAVVHGEVVAEGGRVGEKRDEEDQKQP
jgi:hypothetical protein